MNPAWKSSLPAMLDPVVAAVLEQLKEQVEAKDRVIAEKTRALAAAEAINRQLKEALRLERIHKYGKQSEKLSDLQLELLDREPAVSSEEIETEIAGGPLSEEPPEERNQSSAEQQQTKKRKPHPGRNELPAHLERIEEIVACAAEQCACGQCGGETRVIGYETTEVLGSKPAVHFVRVIKREKRACAHCVEQGVATAPVPQRIAPKIDLRRRNHYRIHRPEICRCAAAVSSARDSAARSRHRRGADHDQRCGAARRRVADSRHRHDEARSACRRLHPGR